MAKRKVLKDNIDSACKQIYLRYMSFMTTAGIAESDIQKILSGTDYEKALRNFAELLANEKYVKVIANLSEACGTGFLNDVFDVMWHYRRNLHFKVDGIPKVNDENFNTLVLNEIDRDICLDISIDGRDYAVYAFKRLYTIPMNKRKLDWTFMVFGYTPSLESKNAYQVAKTASRPAYTMHFEASEDTRRCYVEHSRAFVTDCARVCNKCNKCTEYNYSSDAYQTEFRLYPMKYRADNCNLTEKLNMITPNNILKCIIHALECYKSREIITRKNGKKAAAYKVCRVHVANINPDSMDKIVLLPLHEYVKEYRESHPSEYKGGHHASPIAHTRRGYYRKARKHGDYVRHGDNFVYVGNGEGDYCFVRATQVNNKTDRVVIYQTTSTQKSE